MSRGIKNSIWHLGVPLLIGALLASPLAAQTIYGSLSGTVMDSSGAVITNASVQIKGVDTGQVRQVTTNELGFWRMPSLPPGRYSIEVAFKGFETVIRGPLTV